MEQKYPTREQAQNISTSTCDHEDCDTCEIKRWCCYEDAGRECGASMVAMHDEIDRLIDALADMRFAYVNGDQENPHDYEESAYRKSEALLTAHGKPWLSWEDFRKMYGDEAQAGRED